MKVLIFNGAMERNTDCTSIRLGNYLADNLSAKNTEVQVFNLANAGIPLFDTDIAEIPAPVEQMNEMFRKADVHIWLTPLYHGSMTGAMKNCLDWLECSAKSAPPYLTGKMIGLVCWAGGVQAMQGINSMDAVAKSLRAWTSPYSIPIKVGELFDTNDLINPAYQQRFELMLQVLLNGPNPVK